MRTSLRIVLALSPSIWVLWAVCLFLLSDRTPIVWRVLVVISQERFKLRMHHHFFDCFYSFLSESTVSETAINSKFSVWQKENNLPKTPFLLIPRNKAPFLSASSTVPIALKRDRGEWSQLPLASGFITSFVMRINELQ